MPEIAVHLPNFSLALFPAIPYLPPLLSSPPLPPLPGTTTH